MYKKRSLIIANRNLLAPRPPKSLLIKQLVIRTDQLCKALSKLDSEVVATRQLSLA